MSNAETFMAIEYFDLNTAISKMEAGGKCKCVETGEVVYICDEGRILAYPQLGRSNFQIAFMKLDLIRGQWYEVKA